MRRYPAYKPSGVEWLGEVPEGWEVRRVKTLFAIQKRIAGELGHDVLSVTQKGLRIRDLESNDGQVSMDYTKYQLVMPGDFVMNHMDLLTGWVDVSTFHGVTSPDYRVFTAHSESLCKSFFLYLFQNGYQRRIFYAFGQGASEFGRWRMPTDNFNDFVFPLPPLPEQRAIAAFLDQETAKIDALVAEQRRLIDLLREKRQAVISDAVTKGLNPKAPLKPSGIDWLGDVPEGWEVGPLKYFVTFKSGGTPSKENLDFWDGEIPWASARDLKVEVLEDTALHITDVAVAKGAAALEPAGSVLVLVRGMTLAKAFPVCLTACEMAINQDLKAVWGGSRMSNEFLAWLLRGLADESLSRIDEAGHGTKALRMEAWTSMEVTVPPLPAQAAISAGLRELTAQLDTLTATAESAISLLQERRAALISAAVTGKIDVRALALQTSAPPLHEATQ